MMKLSIRKATNTLWDVHNCAYRMVKVTLNCDQCTFPPFRSRSSVKKSQFHDRQGTGLSRPLQLRMLPSLFPQLRSAVAAIQIFNSLRHPWLLYAGWAVFLEQPSHPEVLCVIQGAVAYPSQYWKIQGPCLINSSRMQQCRRIRTSTRIRDQLPAVLTILITTVLKILTIPTDTDDIMPYNHKL
jgi:hypothetical protein